MIGTRPCRKLGSVRCALSQTQVRAPEASGSPARNGAGLAGAGLRKLGSKDSLLSGPYGVTSGHATGEGTWLMRFMTDNHIGLESGLWIETETISSWVRSRMKRST